MNGHDKMGGVLQEFSVEDLWEIRNVCGPGVGTISIHTAIRADGSLKASVPVKFFSSVLTSFHGQPMPVEFQIAAVDLAGAVANFRSAAELAAKDLVDKLESQYQRSRLTMPGAVGGGSWRPN